MASTEPSLSQVVSELRFCRRLLWWVVGCATVGDLALFLRLLVPSNRGHLPSAEVAVVSLTAMSILVGRRIRLGIRLLEARIAVLLRTSRQNA